MRSTVEEHHHHYSADWVKIILYIFGALTAISIIIDLSDNLIVKLNEDKIVYSNCVNACSEKHFMGLEVGPDGVSASTPFVYEFDRTDCIISCNDLYIKTKLIGGK